MHWGTFRTVPWLMRLLMGVATPSLPHTTDKGVQRRQRPTYTPDPAYLPLRIDIMACSPNVEGTDLSASKPMPMIPSIGIACTHRHRHVSTPSPEFDY
jgi:hypothetical protein